MAKVSLFYKSAAGTFLLIVCLAGFLPHPSSASPSWMMPGASAEYSVKLQGFLPVSDISWKVIGLADSNVTIYESVTLPNGPINATGTYDVSTRRSKGGSTAFFHYAFEWIDVQMVSLGTDVPAFNTDGTNYNMSVVGTANVASREAWELAPIKWNASNLQVVRLPFPIPRINVATWFQNVRIRIFYDKETGILLGARITDPSNILGGTINLSRTSVMTVKTSLPPLIGLSPVIFLLARKLKGPATIGQRTST